MAKGLLKLSYIQNRKIPIPSKQIQRAQPLNEIEGNMQTHEN